MITRVISALATIALTAAGGCGGSGKQQGAASNEVTALLAEVQTVKIRPNPAGYDRSCSKGHACVFGPAWTDVDHNGCDTRNDILNRDLTDKTYKPRTHNCVVIKGDLADPYTGTTIHFTKAKANAVQIDHIYPLSLAWDMGANAWTRQQRVDFANDQDNLLAVDGRTNASKGDQGPGEWLPVNKAYRCEYLKRFLKVAHEHNLPITSADATSIRQSAGGC